MRRRAHSRFYEPVEDRVDPEDSQQREDQDDKREDPEDASVGKLLRVDSHAVCEEASYRAPAHFDDPTH
jgi:hypothetical protein